MVCVGLLINGYHTLPALICTAGQMSWKSGRSSPGAVRRNKLPAAPLVAKIPVPNNAQRNTDTAARSARIAHSNVSGSARQAMGRNGCSMRFCPTPGRSTSGLIPCFESSAAGPMPDNMSN